MKLLFDQNISPRILKLLSFNFTSSTTVKSIGLLNSSDKVIWNYAKENHFTTQDSDFNELNNLYGFPPKIIWIRTGNLRTLLIAEILETHFESLAEFIDSSNYGCFEIFKFGIT